MIKEKCLFCGKKFSLFTLLSVFSGFVVLFMGPGPAHSAESQTAVVATVAPDYSSGAHSVISVDPAGGPRTVQNELLPTISDITVKAYGNCFYRMERSTRNNVTKFDVTAPDTHIWQFSTQGSDTGSSNPHDLVFAGPEKAYLLRYGSTRAWIIDPSATTEAEFKIGELDLSSYADADGLPEMHSGVIIDGKLFITLQRLVSWTPSETAYIAVFDTTTDEEIETGKGEGGRKGIPVEIRNLGTIHYLTENNTVYVQGSGKFYDPPEYTSGIMSIDPDTYDTTLILDDDTNGDGTPLYGGCIAGMAIVSSTKGYFISYAGWGDNTLYAFDPSDSSVPYPTATTITDLENKNIAGMESGVYIDKNNMLWICNQTDARIDILNTTDDTIDESVSTSLNPMQIAFCSEGSPDSDGDSDGDSGCFIGTAACGSCMELHVKVLRYFRDTDR